MGTICYELSFHSESLWSWRFEAVYRWENLHGDSARIRLVAHLGGRIVWAVVACALLLGSLYPLAASLLIHTGDPNPCASDRAESCRRLWTFSIGTCVLGLAMDALGLALLFVAVAPDQDGAPSVARARATLAARAAEKEADQQRVRPAAEHEGLTPPTTSALGQSASQKRVLQAERDRLQRGAR